MPNVSIIIPFRNGERYLKKCISSIENQNYGDWEIILIDDGSTDKSKNIIEKFKYNSKIKYYYIKKDTIGVGKARNYGIEKSNGKYIMFVDVDDYIEDNLLSNLQKYMDKGIELIKYKMKIIEQNNIYKVPSGEFEVTDGQDGFNKLCFYDKYMDSPCLYLIKKELLKTADLMFSENMYHEDFGLIPQLIAISKTIVSTDFYGYNYVQTSDSIMRDENYSKKLKKVNDKLVHYKNMIINLNRFNLQKSTKQNMKMYYSNSIIISLKDLKREDRKKIEKDIRKMKMVKNIKIKNIKQFIKRCILNINIELYLKLKV